MHMHTYTVDLEAMGASFCKETRLNFVLIMTLKVNCVHPSIGGRKRVTVVFPVRHVHIFWTFLK